jgi:VanZ family protein
MKHENKFVYFWLPVFIYCIIIFVQSSFPSPEQIPKLPHLDKVLHFTAYGIMGALFLRAYSSSESIGRNIKLVIFLSILSTTVYGVSDEIHQSYVSSRSSEFFDVVADFFGSFCGTLVYWRFTIKFFSGFPYNSRIDKIANFL